MIGKLSNVASSLPVIGRCAKRPEKRVLFIGLDAAGKTTLLYRLKLSEVVTTIPTIGFNVETIETSFSGRRVDITAWDIGTRDKMRPLLRHYFANTQGIVVVVDRTDVDRLSELENELLSMLTAGPDVDTCPLLFLLNKQDIKKDEVVTEEALRALHFVKKAETERVTAIMDISATTGDGVNEAMQWLTNALFDPQVNSKEVDKPTVGAHWLVEAAKQILCFGS